MISSSNHVNNPRGGGTVPEVIILDDDDVGCGGHTKTLAKQQPTVAGATELHDQQLVTPRIPIVMGLPCDGRPLAAAMESTRKRPRDDFATTSSGPRQSVMIPTPNSTSTVPARKPVLVNKADQLIKNNGSLVIPMGKPPLPPDNPAKRQLPPSSSSSSTQQVEERGGGFWVREFAKELRKGAPVEVLVEGALKMLPNPNCEQKSFHC